MIITALIILGLALLTTLLFVKKNVLAVLVLIPLLYLGYYLITDVVPKYFGYAVPVEFSQLSEGRVINAFMGPEKIYVLLLNKGEKEPRLLALEPTEENKKTLKEMSNGLKQGQSIAVKKNGKKGKGLAKSTDPKGGDLELVPIHEQEEMQKDI